MDTDLIVPGLAGVLLSLMLASGDWRFYFEHTPNPRLFRTVFVLSLISTVGVFAHAVSCSLGNCNFETFGSQVGVALLVTFTTSQLSYIFIKIKRGDK
jgi:hypothetical protein